MEQGYLLKPIIDKDFIFTSKYTKHKAAVLHPVLFGEFERSQIP